MNAAEGNATLTRPTAPPSAGIPESVGIRTMAKQTTADILGALATRPPSTRNSCRARKRCALFLRPWRPVDEDGARAGGLIGLRVLITAGPVD